MTAVFSLSISQLASFCHAQIVNLTEDTPIFLVNSPEKAKAGEICYINHHKDRSWLLNTQASACITNSGFISYAKPELTLILSDNPYDTYRRINNLFFTAAAAYNGSDNMLSAAPDDSGGDGGNAANAVPRIAKSARIAASAVLSSDCVIEEDCHIMGGVYLGARVSIGAGSVVYPNCYLAHASVGKNCVIGPGAVVGSEGFAYSYDASLGANCRLASLAMVVIGDDVEIGANSCVDRGTIRDTTIGSGSKFDNQIHVGHDAIIGSHCIIAAQCALGGHSELGDYCVLGGQVGIIQKITVGCGSFIAAKSTVMRDVQPGGQVGGTPAVPIMEWRRGVVNLHRLSKKAQP